MAESRSSALDLVVPILRCPICGEPLSRTEGSLHCRARHSFDIARHGYASLLTGARPTSGDDAPMVQARRRLLRAGTYAPVLAELVGLSARPPRPPRAILDAGCGPGYYLAGMMDAWPMARGLGLDSSIYALRAAAKAHPRAGAVACDVFEPLPVASASVDLVLDVFAPRNPAEFHRVLRPEGSLVLARPTDGHLAQLRRYVEGMIGIDPGKERRLKRALDPYFKAGSTVRAEYTVRLTPGEAADLVLMTPSARHVTVDDLDEDATGALPAEVDISVLATIYQPR
jgi:23S rRNA (guanine745-N1)-methyltransferase